MIGPIDYIIIGFNHTKFTGEILTELSKSVEKGTIRVLAIAAVAKDTDGNISRLSFDDDGDEATLAFSVSNNVKSDLIDQDDIDEVGDILEAGTSAGLLVIEHIWAKGLKEAIVNAGGKLIADGRIHADAVKELEEEI